MVFPKKGKPKAPGSAPSPGFAVVAGSNGNGDLMNEEGDELNDRDENMNEED